MNDLKHVIARLMSSLSDKPNFDSKRDGSSVHLIFRVSLFPTKYGEEP